MFAEISPFSDSEKSNTARPCSSSAHHFLAIACNCVCVISCFSVFLLFRLLMLFLVLVEVLTEKAYHKAEYAISFVLRERTPPRGGRQCCADGLCKVFYLEAEGADLCTRGALLLFLLFFFGFCHIEEIDAIVLVLLLQLCPKIKKRRGLYISREGVTVNLANLSNPPQRDLLV